MVPHPQVRPEVKTAARKNGALSHDAAPRNAVLERPFAVNAIDPNWHADLTNPLRQIGFYCAWLFVFSRFSLMHELIATFSGFDTHLVILMGVPTVVLTVLTGGIRRTFRGRPAYYWMGFTLWLLAATPFSSWRGGSTDLVLGYFKSEIPVLFAIAGMVMTWRECRQMMGAFALAGLVNVLSGRVFQNLEGGRLSLQFGSIANSNDFVAHLLLILPFSLFVLASPDFGWFRRIVSLGVLVFGLLLAATAGSRGGLIAFAVMCCYFLIRGSWSQRLIFAASVSILLIVTMTMLQDRVVKRYATLFTSEGPSEEEATTSTEVRTYLLETSLQFTLKHPLFGVGPGEFSDYEGTTAREHGKHGAWQVSHNSYTQVSSEAGIPALLFVIAALVSTYLLLNKIHRATRDRPEYRSIALAAFCIQISLVTFCTAIFFLSLAYTMYLPGLIGIAIALSSATQAELAARKAK